ncbi:mannitol dehydrogenase family protein [Paractinoplanes atraurantiacus]|uniref:Mannitol-1-phosphate 5-dehydrogenase n=1 Tax=Paractinoplanes atraurantiacus TaxID=1036182 RepID=A0A285J1W5_9ACTN|nr:mannitol dehydrogenase family protein [Actinoplanes atraurantiacus]SNY54310.1 fructuronate reductase [Actinoplanes atraurantiacus]
MELSRASLPAPGIVHLGLGAFFRAHQAVYTEDALAAAGGDWGIVGVAPRSRTIVDALRAQDCLYSVTTLGPSGTSTRVISALSGAIPASADPAAVVALLADPAIRVVTLTVTEKGYKLDPATGRLLLDDDLRADLEADRAPRTVPGLLIRGLAARRRADAGPIALMSCDNLPSNGHRLRGLVHHLAAATGTAEWVAANVTFPSTMVDRIVPASTAETYAIAERALGVRDNAAVSGEPYRQWVIEDDFPAGRPAWDQAGAVLTGDAQPWERLKIRTLNGVHSAIAYLGALAGRETIAASLQMPGMLPAMRHFIADDITPCLSPPPGVDTSAYGEEVLTRFENPAIAYRTLQVAGDGSQKLPQRVLHTIQDCRKAGSMPRWGALVVAAWMRFVQGTADDGRELPLDDPLADRIRARLAATGSSPSEVVDALLGLDTVFAADLAGDSELRAEIVTWLTALTKHGVSDTLTGVR